jgi:hypothetical protein
MRCEVGKNWITSRSAGETWRWINPRTAPSFCFQIHSASAAILASGQGSEPSSQGSSPCCSVCSLRVRLHSIQFDFPRSRIRSAGQVVPFMVQTVILIPLGVIPKWEPVGPAEIWVADGPPAGTGLAATEAVVVLPGGLGKPMGGLGSGSGVDMMKGRRKERWKRRGRKKNRGYNEREVENETLKKGEARGKRGE